jgi:PIN domain nuclease of toxin-antitoxin system
MRLLLDTHLLVWAMGSPQRLPAGLAPMLEDPSHTPIFSVQPSASARSDRAAVACTAPG